MILIDDGFASTEKGCDQLSPKCLQTAGHTLYMYTPHGHPQAEGSTATHETGSLHSVPNGTELYFQHKNQFVLQVVVTPIRGDATRVTVYGVHVN